MLTALGRKQPVHYWVKKHESRHRRTCPSGNSPAQADPQGAAWGGGQLAWISIA